MGSQEFSEQAFTPDLTPQQVRNLTERLRGRSFYAPVVIETFFDTVQEDSLVAADDHYNRRYAVGGRIAKHPDAYLRLSWSTLSDVTALRLEVSRLSRNIYTQK